MYTADFGGKKDSRKRLPLLRENLLELVVPLRGMYRHFSTDVIARGPCKLTMQITGHSGSTPVLLTYLLIVRGKERLAGRRQW